nr:site-specific integrase [Luteimonas weifangensis]
MADARARHADARRLLSSGIDPSGKRKAEKAAAAETSANTFDAVANELLRLRARKVAAGTAKRERNLLDNYLTPYIGGQPVAEITAPTLLAALRKPESSGKVETAHRARALASMVFLYAVRTGRAERNPAADLRGALESRNKVHLASITDPAEVGPLLRALWGYEGSPVTLAALKLGPMLFARPGELRAARWNDIDLDAAEWRYTASKTRQPHLVPLASQAANVLREIQPLTGRGEFVFPGVRGRNRPMSENTINEALRRLGFDSNTMTGHGFRAMARTILDEVLNFRPDYIEHQLAHAVRDPNGRAYNRTAPLAERRKMMQAWADYLDVLRIGSNVVAMHRRS